MKTFKDVVFKQHKVSKGSIQGLLMLDNGIELSIVAGSFFYSTPRKDLSTPDAFSSFEVAVFDTNGNFIPTDSGDVLGWQSREDIDELIQIHS